MVTLPAQWVSERTVRTSWRSNSRSLDIGLTILESRLRISSSQSLDRIRKWIRRSCKPVSYWGRDNNLWSKERAYWKPLWTGRNILYSGHWFSSSVLGVPLKTTSNLCIGLLLHTNTLDPLSSRHLTWFTQLCSYTGLNYWHVLHLHFKEPCVKTFDLQI